MNRQQNKSGISFDGLDYYISLAYAGGKNWSKVISTELSSNMSGFFKKLQSLILGIFCDNPYKVKKY